MEVKFQKYHGTGNDFIIIDDRRLQFLAGTDDPERTIRKLCDRRFGIGADGLMLLRQAEAHDFEMLYYNADGRPGSMCGNGGRCITAFAHDLGLTGETAVFLAPDGTHQARVIHVSGINRTVSLEMNDVHINPAQELPQDLPAMHALFLDTGSPHLVLFRDDTETLDAETIGRQVRHHPAFAPEGVNVNFVCHKEDGVLFVRTYERGVEAETFSCGTGVTASAIAAFSGQNKPKPDLYRLITSGGELQVSFKPPPEPEWPFTDIRLTGPAVKVFEGVVWMEDA